MRPRRLPKTEKALRGMVAALAALPSMLGHAHAQQSDAERLRDLFVTPVSISSAPRPVGSGARALGMSAFTAIADDATAASWNPAGLIQLERPEISGVMSYLSRSEDFVSVDPGLSLEPGDMTSTDINYLSGVLPFRVFNTNVVASINYQQVYSFDRKLDFAYVSTSKEVSTQNLGHGISLKTTTATERTSEIDFAQDGSIYAITPAFAIQISPRLSFGAAVNFYRNRLTESNTFTETTNILTHWSVNTRSKILGLEGAIQPEPMEFFFEGEVSESKEFSDVQGANVTLGGLWNVTEKVTLGLTADLPYTLDMKEKVTIETKSIRSVDQDGRVMSYPSLHTPPVESDVEYDFPLTLGLGAAYRFSDAFSVAADVGWTDWSRFRFRREDGTEINPISHDMAAEDGKLDPIKDTWAARLGAEYLFILKKTVIPVRAGVFLEQQPGIGAADDIYGASVGTGISIGNVIFDVAYQARFGNDVLGSVFSNVEGTQADTVEHQVFGSVIVHF